MSKLVFKAEDFESIWIMRSSLNDGMVRIAQAVYDKWLSEQTKVYGKELVWNLIEYGDDTHRAYLVDIKDIAPKECEHENVAPFLGAAGNPARMGGFCVQCNKEVRPTGWAVAE